MVTDLQKYYNLLYLIQDENMPEKAILLPDTEELLKIDLNKRTIEGPEYLSVATDHRAETLYFRVARYFDNVDLSQMSCIIQFINAEGTSGIYVVPFYDVNTLADTEEMLFPWVIEGAVTAAAGTVVYSVEFFRIAENAAKYVYNLNTLPAKGKVLEGNKFDQTAAVEGFEKGMGKTILELKDQEKIDFTYANSNLASAYEALINKMDDIKGELNLYWVDAYGDQQ